MAVKDITVQKLTINTALAGITYEAATTASDGFRIPYSSAADNKILLLFKNTNATTTVRTYTVKAGNGVMSNKTDVASGNVSAGGISAIVLESGRFKNMSGDDIGYVKVIPSHAELECAAIVLP
jgi:hypothetical protein